VSGEDKPGVHQRGKQMIETAQGGAIDILTNDTTVPDAASQISTILVSENSLLQAGLEHLLAATRFNVSSGVTGTGPFVLREANAALVIIVMKHCSAKAVELVNDVRAQCPEAKICILADEFEINSLLKAHEAGVTGFCLTTGERKLLTASLDLVMMGEGILPSRVILSALDRMDHRPEEPTLVPASSNENFRAAGLTGQKLSAREGEILRGLMEGAPNKVIARQFGLSEATVKVHVKAILRKIGAKNRTQAAMWAADHIPSQRLSGFS